MRVEDIMNAELRALSRLSLGVAFAATVTLACGQSKDNTFTPGTGSGSGGSMTGSGAGGSDIITTTAAWAELSSSAQPAQAARV